LRKLVNFHTHISSRTSDVFSAVDCRFRRRPLIIVLLGLHTQAGDARLPSRVCAWPTMIRSRGRRLMQVHAVRCQKLAWPLFHKSAKVGIPLCATRLAEGSIRSAWIQHKQRYRFDATSIPSRAALPGRRRPASCACCGVILVRRRLSRRPGWMAAVLGRRFMQRVSPVHQVTLLLAVACKWLHAVMLRNVVCT